MSRSLRAECAPGRRGARPADLGGRALRRRPQIRAGQARSQGGHAVSLRQHEILEIARREGKVLVDALAERFRVTQQTIRRDLGELADEGRLERVHGGAVLPSTVSNIGYED